MHMVEECHLQTALVTAIESRTGGASKTSAAQAARFEKDYNLLLWIATHSDTKDVAPSTTMVKTHLAQPQVEPVATAQQHHASDAGIASVGVVGANISPTLGV